MTVKIENAAIVTPTAVVYGNMLLTDKGLCIDETSCDFTNSAQIRAKYVVPGFVDIHFHGAKLFDFTLGQFSPADGQFDDSNAAYKTGLKDVCDFAAASGVTSLYLATLAGPVEQLNNCLANLADFIAKENPKIKLQGAMIEGSFISREMAGAQNPKNIFKFSAASFDKIKGQDLIKLVNVASDYGKDSVELIRHITAKNIVVGSGHTNATAKQFAEAVKAGLKYAIHFTNGPTGGSYKPFDGGGVIEAVLQTDDVYAEIIPDGYHVNPAYVRDIIKRKGVDKIIAVTVCMYVAGSDQKTLEMNGVHGQVSENQNYIAAKGKVNTLFGSNLTMLKGFENMLNWLTSDMSGIWNKRHEPMSFEQAMIATAKMFSTNPAKMAKLSKIGEIKDNGEADLAVLNVTGSQGNYKVAIESTFVNGQLVYAN